MKERLYERMSETELKYAKCFSDYFEEEKNITFKDSNLEDMYMHNFIFLKKLIEEDELISFIKIKLEEAEKDEKGHLHIIMDYDMKYQDLNMEIPFPEIDKYYFMVIKPKEFNKLRKTADCVILKADTDEILRDGKLVDIIANKYIMGEEFATKRSKRKMEVYKKDPNLNLYVCYKGKEPIGKCELFIKNGIAKIEDFEIIEKYQKQGYGTSMLRKLLEESFLKNAETAYLITDYLDTAQDMYKKCGFSIYGIKTSILFRL